MPSYFFESDHLHKIKVGLKIALFLDFDGTLVPIQKDPAKCSLSEETKKQLRLLTSSKQCYLSILSGRSLSDIRKRVGIQKIYYGGNHGLDISGPGLRYTHPRAMSAKPVIDYAKQKLKKKIVNIKGAWLEDKKFTLSLHFRSVKIEDIPQVKKVFYKTVTEFLNEKHMPQRDTKRNKNVIPRLDRGIQRTKELDSRLHGNDGLEVLPSEELLFIMKGKKVLELVPNVSWDKGKATQWLLQKFGENCLPIYIGDDQTDETAFKALHKKGITIRVGKSKKTVADFYIKGQWEALKLLQCINMSLSSEEQDTV